jgi:hypothetical protein
MKKKKIHDHSAGDPLGSVHVEQFGSGVIFAAPVAGNAVTSPTPMRLGKLEKVSFNVKLKPSEIETLFSKFSVGGRITSVRVNPEIMLGFAQHRSGGGNAHQRRVWRRMWTPRQVQS